MADGDGDKKINTSIKPASIARIFDLVRKHCTADQWGEWLRVPFEFAAFEGDQELALELSKAGAAGDPFEMAIRGGQHDFVGCHLRTPRDGNLQLAVELGLESIVSLLLDLGADTEAKSFEGRETRTPLLQAAKAGNAGIVGLLLDAGASAHRRLRKREADEWTDTEQEADTEEVVETESALDFAAIGGHVDVIQEITRRDPSCVNSVSPSAMFTALHYAAEHSQLGAIDALVEAGADLEAQDGYRNGTALHAAVGSPDCGPTLLALLRHGAQVDPSTYNTNTTPLCVAVRTRNRVAADTLLSAGAKVDIPLLCASAVRSSRDMILALLGRGADVNTRRASDGNTPLHLAARIASKVNVEVLLKAGGDETAVNDSGSTPLHVIGRDWSVSLSRICEFSDDDIRLLLAHAPRDRAWSRRGFFVLCRAFPERVRLQQAPSQEGRVNDARSAASSASNDTLISSASTKRVATAEGRGGEGGQPAGGHALESATAFRDAMGRLMGLEADAVFRNIVEFV